MAELLKIAAQVGGPIPLAAIALVLLYGLYKLILGALPEVPRGEAPGLLHKIINFIFILTLVAIVMGIIAYVVVTYIQTPSPQPAPGASTIAPIATPKPKPIYETRPTVVKSTCGQWVDQGSDGHGGTLVAFDITVEGATAVVDAGTKLCMNCGAHFWQCSNTPGHEQPRCPGKPPVEQWNATTWRAWGAQDSRSPCWTLDFDVRYQVCTNCS